MPSSFTNLKYKLVGDQIDNKVRALKLELYDEGPGYYSHICEGKMYRVLEGNVQFIVNDTASLFFKKKATDRWNGKNLIVLPMIMRTETFVFMFNK